MLSCVVRSSVIWSLVGESILLYLDPDTVAGPAVAAGLHDQVDPQVANTEVLLIGGHSLKDSSHWSEQIEKVTALWLVTSLL